MRVKKGGEFVKRERGEVGPIKRVGIEVEDGFASSGGSGSKDGLR